CPCSVSFRQRSWLRCYSCHSCLCGCNRWLNEAAFFILDECERRFCCQGITQFNISNRVCSPFYSIGNTFISWCTNTSWPCDGFAFSNLLTPSRTNVRKVICPHKTSSGTIRSVYYYNIISRKCLIWIQ